MAEAQRLLLSACLKLSSLCGTAGTMDGERERTRECCNSLATKPQVRSTAPPQCTHLLHTALPCPPTPMQRCTLLAATLGWPACAACWMLGQRWIFPTVQDRPQQTWQRQRGMMRYWPCCSSMRRCRQHWLSSAGKRSSSRGVWSRRRQLQHRPPATVEERMVTPTRPEPCMGQQNVTGM